VSGSSTTRYPWGDRPLGREDILTAGQVAELLGLREGTIEDYARRDLLPSFKLGKHRRFIRAQVEARIADLLDRAA
jgi:excisionase family DNA binding protein